MSDTVTPMQAPEQLAVEEIKELPKAPEPKAMGNARIEVLKHNLTDISPLEEYNARPGVDLAIRNVSSSTIATAIFEAVFYDETGNIVERARHEEVTLDPETSRGVHIGYSPHLYGTVTSYDIRLVRTITADREKVQVTRHELGTAETGAEEITGIAKNISDTKTDAAVVATFYDLQQEIVGTKVLVLRDMEPHTIRQFVLVFKPQEGDIVLSYTLRVGEVAG